MKQPYVFNYAILCEYEVDNSQYDEFKQLNLKRRPGQDTTILTDSIENTDSYEAMYKINKTETEELTKSLENTMILLTKKPDTTPLTESLENTAVFGMKKPDTSTTTFELENQNILFRISKPDTTGETRSLERE